MKRSSEFLIAAAAALITFGTLTLAMGPRHFGWGAYHHHRHGVYHAPHSCPGEDGEHHHDKSESQEPAGS